MDFDIISAVIGLVVGFTIAAAMGRSKFARVQEQLRDTERDLDAAIDNLYAQAQTKLSRSAKKK